MNREGSFLIGHIKLLSGRILNRMFLDNDVTDLNGEQGKILYALWKNNCISSSDLSSQTGLALNSLTKMLDLMEKKGLVERKPCNKDKRKRLVSITEKGRKVQEKSVEINNLMESVFYDGFTDDEILRFEGDLKHILNNLKRWEEGNERNYIGINDK